MSDRIDFMSGRDLWIWEIDEYLALREAVAKYNSSRPRVEHIFRRHLADDMGVGLSIVMAYMSGRKALDMSIANAVNRLTGIPIQQFSPRLAGVERDIAVEGIQPIYKEADKAPGALISPSLHPQSKFQAETANLISPSQQGTNSSIEQHNHILWTDEIRVNVKDVGELKYWAKKFGVSRNEIKSAVKKAGDSLTAIQRQIKLARNA